MNEMKRRLLECFVCLCGAFVLSACSGGDDADGPAGSVEMLYGTWGVSHMRIEVMGQVEEMDAEASLSTITFYSDGTAVEQQPDATAYATWSYSPASRLLRLTDSSYGTVLDWHVRSLTDSRLIVDFSTSEQGIEMKMRCTYDRLSRSSSSAADASAALCGTLKKILSR